MMTEKFDILKIITLYFCAPPIRARCGLLSGTHWLISVFTFTHKSCICVIQLSHVLWFFSPTLLWNCFLIPDVISQNRTGTRDTILPRENKINAPSGSDHKHTLRYLHKTCCQVKTMKFGRKQIKLYLDRTKHSIHCPFQMIKMRLLFLLMLKTSIDTSTKHINHQIPHYKWKLHLQLSI